MSLLEDSKTKEFNEMLEQYGLVWESKEGETVKNIVERSESFKRGYDGKYQVYDLKLIAGKVMDRTKEECERSFLKRMRLGDKEMEIYEDFEQITSLYISDDGEGLKFYFDVDVNLFDDFKERKDVIIEKYVPENKMLKLFDPGAENKIDRKIITIITDNLKKINQKEMLQRFSGEFEDFIQRA